MKPEERADKVEIVEEDCGDWHVSDWRVSEDETRANIAAAIREAERDAAMEADLPSWESYLGERRREQEERNIKRFRELAAAIRALE